MLWGSRRAWSSARTGGLAAFDGMFRAADRVRRVAGEDLADDQPVEEHAEGGEVLLHGRLGELVLQDLDIGRDVQRLDADELGEAVRVAPREEVADGPVIGGARVLVAEGGGEEFEEAARRSLAGGGDDRRDRNAASRWSRDDRGWRFGDDLAHAG